VSGEAARPVRACKACGTELPASLLACPSCGRLVHADALKALAADAASATGAGDTRAALAKWREAQMLLPPGSRQRARVEETVKTLSEALDAGGAGAGTGDAGPSGAAAPGAAAGGGAAGGAAAPKKRGKIYAGLTALGALLMKFKLAIVFLLAKGKVLLAGVFQAKTFLTMAIAVGVYAMAFGWHFAVGLIASIYVHEMGHVERLRHYGIRATAPMFIPGFGAFVRLKQHPASAREDARIGLAGPLWGTAAALAFLVAGRAGHHPGALAIARVGAWINLFNLVPVWQLDGGRAFNALSRRQRGLSAGLLWVLTLMGIDGMLMLLAIGATFRATRKDAPAEGDAGAFLEYSALVLALVVLMVLART
jgi:Zn-dependent protease